MKTLPFTIISNKCLLKLKSNLYLQPLTRRAISSAGSEHLVYTEGVGGSNPSSPTTKLKNPTEMWDFFVYIITLIFFIFNFKIINNYENI